MANQAGPGGWRGRSAASRRTWHWVWPVPWTPRYAWVSAPCSRWWPSTRHWASRSKRVLACGPAPARIGRELRERALSRLGLADDARDALARTRERAAVRAATIATSRKPNLRTLRRAVLKSGAATSPEMRALLLDTRAALGSVDTLVDMDVDSPWTSGRVDEPVPVPSVPRPRTAPT